MDRYTGSNIFIVSTDVNYRLLNFFSIHFQASFVIDQLFDIPCKLIHISPSDSIRNHVSAIRNYFENFYGLIMMGGNLDASSKGIAGIHIFGNKIYLLIVVSSRTYYCKE